MNISAQSDLVAIIVSAAIAISVLLRVRRGRIRALFILFCSNLFAHYVAAFLYNLATHPFWFRIDLLAAALLPVTGLLSFGHFLWRDPSLPNRYLRVAYVLSGTLAMFLMTPWSENRVTTGIVLTYTFAGLYLCGYLIYVRLREVESAREQTRLKYLLAFHLATISFVLLGICEPLQFLRTWGDLLSVFFLYVLSQSLMKYRLLDLQELLGRALVLTGIALILAVVFGVLVLLAGGDLHGSLFQTFVASIVILILFEPLRDKVEGNTNRLLFREHYELCRKLEEMRREVASILDLEHMTSILLNTVYESMRASNVSFYLQEEGGVGYRLVDYRGLLPVERIDVAAHRAFFDQIKKTPTAILAERFERQLDDQGAPADSEPTGDVKHAHHILDTLQLLKAGVSIPLVGQNDVLGLWNLQDQSSGIESYSTEEIARLMAVGEQAAINIENSRIFERIRERDRLVVLGEMSAGLAHEIRNPLSAIKGAAQYLEPERVGEEAADFLHIIIEEVDRLNEVVDQFLDYARPFHAKFAPCEINKIIEHTGRLLGSELENENIKLAFALAPNLPMVQANDQQLMQVFLNLFKNSIDAMPVGGKLIVRTSFRQPVSLPWIRPTSRPPTVLVEVIDTGSGIPTETMSRIFVPFFTTKEHGTGLGLAISQRIVEKHQGQIRVRSKQGEGSTFLVEFPCIALSEKHSSLDNN